MERRAAPARTPARTTAFYARVTTAESRKKDLSLPNQKRRFHELAAQHGWVGAEFVEEQALSGELPIDERPALRALADAVRAGQVERVVARHLDRLGRGIVLEEIVALLRQHGVELWTFDGKQDVKSAAGRLGVRAQAMVGAFEVERGGERVREMKRQKARAGYYVGPTPYGFTSQSRLARELAEAHPDLSKEEVRARAQEQLPVSGHLYIDESEAAVVREVFGLYVEERLGTRVIARRLNKAGHRTRGGYLFASQQVQKVVRDPRLAGFVTFDEDAYDSGQPSGKPVHEQTFYQGKHQPIIERELWEAAQDHRRAGSAGRAPNRRKRVHPLRGVIRCAHGHNASARSSGLKRGDADYYTCRRRQGRSADPEMGGCDAPTIRTEVAESAVREVLCQLLGHPDRLHDYLRAAQIAAARNVPDGRQVVAAIDGEIRAAESSRERYYRLLEATEPGSDGEQVALDRVVDIKRRLQDLDLRRAEAEARVVEMPRLVSREQVERFVGTIQGAMGEDPREFQRLIGLLHREHGLQVEITSNSTVQVSLALDSGALGVDGARVVASASPRVPASGEGSGGIRQSLEEWVAEQQSQHFCQCGCGQAVEVKPKHRAPSKGIPKYVHGHQLWGPAKVIQSANAEGLLSVSQAAAELGVSEMTLRRAEGRGLVKPTRRSFGGRSSMRLFKTAELPALREKLVADGVCTGDDVVTAPELAGILGVAQNTLRRWESIGRLPQPRRTSKGHRIYGAADVERVQVALADEDRHRKIWLAAEGLVARAEAQELLGVTQRQMQRLIRGGVVTPVWRTPPGTRKRAQFFRRSDVEALAEAHAADQPVTA